MAAEGGSIERPGYFPGGLAVAMAKLAQKGKVEDAIKGSDVVDEEIYMTEDEDENGGGIWDSIKESILTPSGSNPTPGLIEESGGDTGAAGFVKRALGEVTEDARSDVMKAIIMEARLKQPEGPLLQDTIDTVAKAFMSSGIFSGSEEEVDDSMKFMQGRYDDFINDAVDTGGSDIPPGFDPYMYAKGGITDLDLRGGGASFGPGTGTSDDIPAMLSDGEFVVTANAVRNLGGGDRMEGARRMYSMMNQLDPQSQSPAEMSGVGYA
jgi:hypothetical protein